MSYFSSFIMKTHCAKFIIMLNSIGERHNLYLRIYFIKLQLLSLLKFDVLKMVVISKDDTNRTWNLYSFFRSFRLRTGRTVSRRGQQRRSLFRHSMDPYLGRRMHLLDSPLTCNQFTFSITISRLIRFPPRLFNYCSMISYALYALVLDRGEW